MLQHVRAAERRYLIVYPGLLRDIGKEWQAGMRWAGVSPKSSM